MSGRYKLNEFDMEIIQTAKEDISFAIDLLKQRGVRYVNIEIELVSHIKNELKE